MESWGCSTIGACSTNWDDTVLVLSVFPVSSSTIVYISHGDVVTVLLSPYTHLCPCPAWWPGWDTAPPGQCCGYGAERPISGNLDRAGAGSVAVSLDCTAGWSWTEPGRCRGARRAGGYRTGHWGLTPYTSSLGTQSIHKFTVNVRPRKTILFG